MKLSYRLETVASFVTKGSIVADVGTDHGYIPIFLVEEGIAPSAIAMDLRKGPLERAREHVRERGLEGKIETRLGDGLENLAPGEADTVVIAGMGGELICRILEGGRRLWDQVGEWVLSPQSELSAVRLFLWENGFSLEDEAMVLEDGKYYTVMRCGRKGQQTEERPSPAQLKYGPVLLKRKDPVLREFLAEERQKLEAIADTLRESGTEKAAARFREVEAELALAKEAYDEVQGSDTGSGGAGA
ncbi:tRNA (adenine(22)-N(1))-methyltransferase [Lachnoclostridium sp. An14]|uniref:tRNA (adenine(22)-N(1))-methyltransferase n=1 Tax=Lachnoclostridium sp. An14 TaxID=1965562 RepID=UPI000B3B0825|nr:class I SAM-dependent methyltransferase [Lachnoclostridium sp. An14]OUQ21037.1 tRNA (adenine(22)-N(1))-methyltransferase [Lachnoclostridium sp. An14]